MASSDPLRRRPTGSRLVLALASRPRWVLPVVAGVLLVGGLAGSGPLAVTALVVVAALLGLLARHSWPVIDPQGRLLRVAAVVVLLLVAFAKL